MALDEKRGVKVAAGRGQPLRGKNAFPWPVRFMMDQRLFLSLPAARETADPCPAVEVLAEEIQRSERKVSIVALGPLTNLAELFDPHPELVTRVERIYSMGGALHVPGNLGEMLPKSPNLHAEWNYYCDPYACSRVFRSGVPLTIIPLDATNQVPLTSAFIRRVQDAPRTPVVDFLAGLLGRISRLLGPSRTFYMWDPLTAVAAVHPEIIGIETICLRMEEDGPQQGSIFADPAGTPIPGCLPATGGGSTDSTWALYLQKIDPPNAGAFAREGGSNDGDVPGGEPSS